MLQVDMLSGKMCVCYSMLACVHPHGAHHSMHASIRCFLLGQVFALESKRTSPRTEMYAEGVLCT